MKKIGKMCLVLLVVAALAIVPASAMADRNKVGKDAGAEAMTADILMARPIGLFALIVGSSLFVVSLPLSGLGGNVDAAARKLVVEPAKYTFDRPLGEF